VYATDVKTDRSSYVFKNNIQSEYRR